MLPASLFDLQRATLAARARLADPTIGTTVRAGRFSVVRVTYPADKRGASDVVHVAGPFTAAECCAYLDRMA